MGCLGGGVQIGGVDVCGVFGFEKEEFKIHVVFWFQTNRDS